MVALGRSLWLVILGPAYAPYWRLAVQYWQQYVQLWRGLRAAQSRQEYVQCLRTEYVQLLRAALITFGGTRPKVKALPPEGRRESSIRPHYDA